MNIRHILFDVYGTLADSTRLKSNFAAQVGQVMAERFGGQPDAWAQAHRRVVADWDSYYVDLDFTGENGLDDLREGEIRTTRALFRLTSTTEPASAALKTLARDLHYLAARRCDVFYDDSKPVVRRLHAAGYTLGIACHAASRHIQGTLEGAGLADCFSGAMLTPDLVGRFTKDQVFFVAVGFEHAQGLLVDDGEEGIRGAKAAGMRAVQILRDDRPPSPLADHALRGDLTGLLKYLGIEP